MDGSNLALLLFTFLIVARARSRKTLEAEGYMGAPVLFKDVSLAHGSLDLTLRTANRNLMNRYLFRNWRKVENGSISSELLMTFSSSSLLINFIYCYAVDIDQAGLSSFSWKDSLRFERPVTPDCLSFQPS